MADLFPTGTDLAAELNVIPPPPEELRREGDRRRRRTRVLVAGATAVIIAAVAIPLALRSTDDDRGAPIEPAASTPATLTTEALAKLLPRPTDLTETGYATTPWQIAKTAGQVPSAPAAPCGTETIPSGYASGVSEELDTGGGPTNFSGQMTALQYADAATASAAFDQLDQAFSGCTSALRSRGETSVSTTQTDQVELGDAASASRRAKTYYTTHDSPPGHMTLVQVQHALALDGPRLLVATISQEVQDNWADLAVSMPQILDRFLQVESVPYAVIDDYQYRYVRLGETLTDVKSDAGVTCDDQTGRAAWHCTLPDGVRVCGRRGHGVQAIPLTEHTATTDGLRFGDSVDDVRRIYPDAQPTDDHSGWIATPPDSVSVYRITTGDDGPVQAIVLEAPGQSCTG